MPRSCASPRSDQIADNDHAGYGADTGLQGGVRLYLTDGTNQLQPGPHRPLGVILVSLRIAEISERAIAQIFGDESVKPVDSLRNAFLIGRDDLAQILRVHTRRECCRTDKVREHHRDLAALCGILLCNRRCNRRRGFRRTFFDPTKFCYGLQLALADVRATRPRVLLGLGPLDHAGWQQ